MYTLAAVVSLLAASFIGSLQAEDWQGKWFPSNLTDSKHGVKMGVPNKDCDDGHTLIENDYNGTATEYICLYPREFYLPNPDTRPILIQEKIPEGYATKHYCMKSKIRYDRPIPTFGSHRPIWATYGEYLYIPRQRWLHNLEHGAIVMLYHPCADSNEVKAMKKILKNCVFHHIISANQNLSPDRPLGLVAWGYLLLMSKLNEELTIQFIREHVNKAAERISKSGHYKYQLVDEAKMISSKFDDHPCPNYA